MSEPRAAGGIAVAWLEVRRNQSAGVRGPGRRGADGRRERLVVVGLAGPGGHVAGGRGVHGHFWR